MALISRHPASRRLGLLASVLSALSCSEEVGDPQGIVHPTLVEVAPAEFLGSVPCSDAPGAMRSYAVHLFERPPNEPVFPADPVRVSAPEPCNRSVAFEGKVTGTASSTAYSYKAIVFVYDRVDLRPPVSTEDDAGGAATGTAGAGGAESGVGGAGGADTGPVSECSAFPEGTLVDSLTGECVAPHLTTTCGQEDGTRALFARTVTLRDCEPKANAGSLPGPGVVEVRLDSALGTLRCGDTPGAVERFELELPSGESRSAACTEAITLQGVSRGALSLPVAAYEAGSDEPSWGTTCLADVVAGITTSVSCQPLTDHGALDVEPAEALAAWGATCEELGYLSLQAVDADGATVGNERTVGRAACGRTVRFTGLERGAAEVRVTFDGRPGAAHCGGNVVPGRAVPARCTLDL